MRNSKHANYSQLLNKRDSVRKPQKRLTKREQKREYLHVVR